MDGQTNGQTDDVKH